MSPIYRRPIACDSGGKRKSLSDVDEYGRTALWYHALNGEVELARKAIKAGSDPKVGDKMNYTPLHAAVQSGHVEMIELLLQCGADPNARDKFGNNSLMTALLKTPNDKRARIIPLLFHAGADPHAKNESDNSPYEVAMTMEARLKSLFDQH